MLTHALPWLWLALAVALGYWLAHPRGARPWFARFGAGAREGFGLPAGAGAALLPGSSAPALGVADADLEAVAQGARAPPPGGEEDEAEDGDRASESDGGDRASEAEGGEDEGLVPPGFPWVQAFAPNATGRGARAGPTSGGTTRAAFRRLCAPVGAANPLNNPRLTEFGRARARPPPASFDPDVSDAIRAAVLSSSTLVPNARMVFADPVNEAMLDAWFLSRLHTVPRPPWEDNGAFAQFVYGDLVSGKESGVQRIRDNLRPWPGV